MKGLAERKPSMTEHETHQNYDAHNRLSIGWEAIGIKRAQIIEINRTTSYAKKNVKYIRTRPYKQKHPVRINFREI